MAFVPASGRGEGGGTSASGGCYRVASGTPLFVRVPAAIAICCRLPADVVLSVENLYAKILHRG